MNNKFYEPAEDSILLLNSIINFLNSKKIKEEIKKIESFSIFEVGVGSGFIISNIYKKYPKFKYFGSDINKEAVIETNNKLEELNKRFNKNQDKKNYLILNKSLFEGFKNKKFNLIYFNTPYLPCEEGEEYDSLNILDKAIYGGKNGYEIIKNFIEELNKYLNDEGHSFILFSSLSKPEIINRILENNLFKFEKIKSEKHFFEELIIYKISKKEVLKRINLIGVKSITFLAKGKHSIVMEGIYKNKNVIIKISIPQHIEKEAYFLKRLEKEKFVKKLLYLENEFIIKEKSEGIIIKDFLDYVKPKDNWKIIKVFNNILNICFRLDEIGINKFEMTNPYKHIFVQENLDVEMIDFERALFSSKPKNTTQFLQYILRRTREFKTKNINISSDKVLTISKNYKLNRNKFKFEDLINNPHN